MNLLFKNYKSKYFILLCLLHFTFLFYLIYKQNNVLKEIEENIKDNLKENLYDDKSKLTKKNNNPQISIIIPTFNGEVYLKPVILSVQKQNFSNIEIIIIDDGSEDNSDNVIKELTKEDERIISIKNKRNRGTLYSKTIGVINAKGKYVMTLDHDDFYANEKVFYTLYNEAEKYNLDLLGFASINTTIGDDHLKIKEYINYIKTPVIKQPNIKKRFLGFGKERSVTLLCMYFIKTNLFKLVIKKLGDIFINRNIDAHDDTIIMFLLSRNASSLKHLKDIFYIIFIWPEEYSASLNFQKIVKYRERTRKNCFSYLTFAEVLLMFSQNNEEDKFVAEYYFLKYFIREEECKNKKDIINNAIRICILYLDNKFISNNAKREISLYLYELIKYNKNDIKNKRIFY